MLIICCLGIGHLILEGGMFLRNLWRGIDFFFFTLGVTFIQNPWEGLPFLRHQFSIFSFIPNIGYFIWKHAGFGYIFEGGGFHFFQSWRITSFWGQELSFFHISDNLFWHGWFLYNWWEIWALCQLFKADLQICQTCFLSKLSFLCCAINIVLTTWDPSLGPQKC